MHRREFTRDLIAPFGMNCGICKWYLAYSKRIPKERGKISHCPRCLPRNKNCFIKRERRKLWKKEINFCYECGDMPCENLDHLVRRYRQHYGMNMVENLRELKDRGMKEFLRSQRRSTNAMNAGMWSLFTTENATLVGTKSMADLKWPFRTHKIALYIKLC